ncbi:MAG: hypothetical protein OXE99_04785 [Cellvibrionales bacterium]|nr:hypothetical protein [Cellvibrionales bacterium]
MDMKVFAVFFIMVQATLAYSQEDGRYKLASLYFTNCIFESKGFDQSLKSFDKQHFKQVESKNAGETAYLKAEHQLLITLSKTSCSVQLGQGDVQNLKDKIYQALKFFDSNMAFKTFDKGYKGVFVDGGKTFNIVILNESTGKNEHSAKAIVTNT